MRSILAATALALLPAQQALASAVCFSGRDESRVAYLLTTLFMTAIPIAALAAGIVWVVRKAARQHDASPGRAEHGTDPR
jgi:hypothetical protein